SPDVCSQAAAPWRAMSAGRLRPRSKRRQQATLWRATLPPPYPPPLAGEGREGGDGRMTPLLTVSDLKKHFPLRGSFGRAEPRVVDAVDGVSFHIDRGETLALVGESGCGKSTVGRAILRLFDITAGQVVLDGRRIDDMAAGALRPLRRRMQVVFQDPFSS